MANFLSAIELVGLIMKSLYFWKKQKSLDSNFIEKTNHTYI